MNAIRIVFRNENVMCQITVILEAISPMRWRRYQEDCFMYILYETIMEQLPVLVLPSLATNKIGQDLIYRPLEYNLHKIFAYL